uniref:Putative secreted protein with Kunitz domain n=1 Tax=Ixodes scapularis TaxID=6945 RepID=Q4PN99_IXOSC|nr:putative secreted protein with Kunitz domain [Ixodes scapularis]
MKAILAVTCIFSAVVLISGLSKEVCEAPHAMPQCAPDVPPRVTYYFNNGTGRCESDYGCGSGQNDFATAKECRDACPYGKYALSG